MSNNTKQIVEKAWGFAHVLREEGLSYLAYIEQITFLLFLKMADEIAIRHPEREPLVPRGWGWDSLMGKNGTELKVHYDAVLERLSQQPGMLGDIFRKPRPEIENPRTLRRLVADLIDPEEWTTMDADVSGDIYEGLLARTASESPRGAGQYFTPRPLIAAIVDCIRPTATDTVCDPAAGTGGFLLAAHKFATEQSGPQLTDAQSKHLAQDFVHGWEIVPNTARLCIANLFLHGVNAAASPIQAGVDALAMASDRQFSIVLANPPFGKKGSLASAEGDEGGTQGSTLRRRTDFWVATANKQLNFLQHAFTLLKPEGRCAIVLPDNVLFEGGAGEVIRRTLLKECYVHTLLRLPPGIFYAQGVKANVLFFDRKSTSKRSGLWVYDLRTNKNFTLRNRIIQRSDFEEFVTCYNAQSIEKRKETWSENNLQGRWRKFDYDTLLTREKTNLDFNWLKSDEAQAAGAELVSPQDLAAQITMDLRIAMEQFQKVSERLK